jgi:hypothetical protein
MARVIFLCPKCATYVLRGVAEDDMLALIFGLPICCECWACGADSLVIHKECAPQIPVGHHRFFRHCLNIAVFCRRKASETANRGVRKWLLRKEHDWLSLGGKVEFQRFTTMVTARVM